ncbi:hypothetical protein [Streptomyces sp. NPDC088910]|uniref:hypothetical protein n=1 Tax=Streptomyces sp. NPDC088910 TaxID=3365911 RepID=UPI003803A450
MTVRNCTGWVPNLRGQFVTFTGKVEINGDRMYRRECERRVSKLNGQTATDFSGKVTLLVQGSLDGQSVIDTRRGYSEKLVDVQRTRLSGGPHVHVIDSDGFGELLAGRRARCRRLRGSGAGVEFVPELGDGVLGVELAPRAAPVHVASDLAIDLSALDAGTAAHEATIRALAVHLDRRGVRLLGPAPRAPLFDAGWVEGEQIFIAEVKSLGATGEDQQIRLGLGQILDYAYQLAGADPVVPVLVLERSPSSNRWAGLTTTLGVRLAFGPTFAGL